MSSNPATMPRGEWIVPHGSSKTASAAYTLANALASKSPRCAFPTTSQIGSAHARIDDADDDWRRSSTVRCSARRSIIA